VFDFKGNPPRSLSAALHAYRHGVSITQGVVTFDFRLPRGNGRIDRHRHNAKESFDRRDDIVLWGKKAVVMVGRGNETPGTLAAALLRLVETVVAERTEVEESMEMRQNPLM